MKKISHRLEGFVYKHLLLVSLSSAILILAGSYLLRTNNQITEAISNLSTFGILIISILALEIIKTTRTEALTRYKRESVQASLIQIERFKKDILPSTTCVSLFKLPTFNKNKIQKFTKNEISELGIDYTKKIDEFIGVNPPTNEQEARAKRGRYLKYKSVESAINEAEIFSISITSKLCDGEMMFPTCSNVFCSFVEENYIHYCDNRTEDNQNLYKNTIDLYHTWSTKIKRTALDAEMLKLKLEDKATPYLSTKILGEE